MDLRLTPLPTAYTNEQTMAAAAFLQKNLTTVIMPYDFLSQTINVGTNVPPSPWLNNWNINTYALFPVGTDTGLNILPVKVVIGAYSFLPVVNLSKESEFKFLIARRVSSEDEWMYNSNREWYTGGIYSKPSDDDNLFDIFDNDEGTEKYLVIYPNQSNMFVRLYFGNSKLKYLFTSLQEPESPATNMSVQDYISNETIALFDDSARLIYSL